MRRIIVLSLSFLLCACAATMESQLDAVRTGYVDGNYVATATEFSSGNAPESQNNLELLITADSLFHANEFAASDAAYEEFNHRNIDLTSGDLGREVGALLAGNLANDYRPYMSDALFVSYYQLWNALALGNHDDARVIINQSYARQQDMSHEYDALVQQIQSERADNTDLAEQLDSENSQWRAFRDIMNPALMYLSGLYFLNVGDYANAKTYLQRADGMAGNNKYVKSDLRAANARTTPKNTIWVFVEDGFAPKLREDRMDTFVVFPTGPATLSVAVSEPLFAAPMPMVDGAEIVADVDALFMTEYTQYRVNEALRAFASAVSKAALQSALYNSDSDSAPLMGLLSTIYTLSTTNAEVRTWATLPQRISVWRTTNNKTGLLEIKSGGNLVVTAEIPSAGNYLVYVRLTGGTPDVKTIKIK